VSLNRRVESDLVPHASSSLLYLAGNHHADRAFPPARGTFMHEIIIRSIRVSERFTVSRADYRRSQYGARAELARQTAMMAGVSSGPANSGHDWNRPRLEPVKFWGQQNRHHRQALLLPVLRFVIPRQRFAHGSHGANFAPAKRRCRTSVRGSKSHDGGTPQAFRRRLHAPDYLVFTISCRFSLAEMNSRRD
jgi:hypothetical protein